MRDEDKVEDKNEVEEAPSNHDRYGDSCFIRFFRISSADPIKPIRAMAAPMIYLIHMSRLVEGASC